MSTLEKYILICRIIGQAVGIYKYISGTSYATLKGEYISYDEINTNKLTKSNLILANSVWSNIIEIYDTEEFEIVFADDNSCREVTKYIELLKSSI